MSNPYFREKLYTSPVPIQPKQIDDAFRECFGYKFAQALNDFNWSKEATPSHMVTTYPVALQRAWEEIDSMDDTWKWWNQAYDTTPMIDMYAHLLHQTVDLACHQNQWSHVNNKALHAYVEEFMSEMRAPTKGLPAAMCREVLQNITMMADGLEQQFDIPEELASNGAEVIQMATNLLVEGVPDTIHFEGAWSICEFTGCLKEEFEEHMEDLPDVAATRCPVESAFLTTLLQQTDAICVVNIKTLPTNEAQRFFDAIPAMVNQILRDSSLKIDALYAFHNNQVDLQTVLGYDVDKILNLNPQMKNLYDMEAACACEYHGYTYDNKFDGDDIARGFMQLTPATEDAFECISDLVSVMSLAERQHFLELFQKLYAEHPADCAGAILKAFEQWRNTYDTNPEISGEFLQAGGEAVEYDKQLLEDMKTLIPPKDVVQTALGLMEQLTQRAGVTPDAFQEFHANITAGDMSCDDASYTHLYTLAEMCSPCLDENKEWKQWWQQTAGKTPDTYQVWMQVVDTALKLHMQYGGYAFQNPIAQHCAMAGKDTFSALPMELRYQLAQNIEDAVQHEEHLPSCFQEACRMLPEDIQTQIAHLIAHDIDAMEREDIDIADITS